MSSPATRIWAGMALILLLSLNVSWKAHFKPYHPQSQPARNDRPQLVCRPENLLFPAGGLAGGLWPGRSAVGKVALCYFWAPWCQPSREQAAWLNDLWLQYRPLGLVLIGFCLEQDRKTVLDFYRRTGLLFPSALAAPDQVSVTGKVKGLPVLFLLSAQGDVLRKYEGLHLRSVLEQDILAACRYK